MKLTRLVLQVLPGIEPGFVLDSIAPGINCVTGPNAIGKSSLIRALGYLITEPQADDPSALSLSAVFDAADGPWVVRRTGRELVWEREGRADPGPLLPDRDQLYCYWLSMEELIRADQRDDQLVAELRRSLSGGYDLAVLRRTPPFEIRPRIGLVEGRRVREAERTLRQIESQYKALRREEASVPLLESQVEAARQAAGKASLLTQALELLAVHQDVCLVEQKVQSFPENMDRIRGDELQRMEQLEQEIRELCNERDSMIRARESTSKQLNLTGMTGNRPAKVDLESQFRQLQQARRKWDQRENELKRLEEAKAAERSALSSLGDYRDRPLLDPNRVSQAELLARDLHAAELQKQEIASRLEKDCQYPDQSDIDRHFLAEDSLRSWLAAEGSTSKNLRLALIVTLAGSLFTLGVTVFTMEWIASLGALSVLGGTALAWLAFFGSGSTQARHRFEESDLKPPAAWQRRQVGARLREIEIARSELQQQYVSARQATEYRGRLKRIEKELQTLNEKKTELADQLGFDPELTATALDRFARLVQDYDRFYQETEFARAAIALLDHEIQELTGQVRQFLEQWNMTSSDSNLDVLELKLMELKQQIETAESLERDLEEIERDTTRIEKRLKALDDERTVLLRNAGLDTNQRSQLEQCIEVLVEWRTVKDQLKTVQIHQTEKRRRLEGEEELLRQVDASDREGLTRELVQAEEEASMLEAWQEELIALRTRLGEAGRDHQLKRALSELDTTYTALEDRYHETMWAEAAHLLLDDVEAEYRSEHEPEVLQDARERFGSFTHHSYELELDETRGFVARDRRRNVLAGLAELSSATRMQLLLAMRLAWTRRLEQHSEALPFFLDEALTTSDEFRFSKVVESLEQLAHQENRQVFYLSARRLELDLWEQATGIRPHHIDLAQIRFGQGGTEPGDFALPETTPLPLPEGRSPEDYAALVKVPPVDPTQSEGAVHLFHLLRDQLSLLHHLMEQWRIVTLGQLEGLLHSNARTSAIRNVEMGQRLEGRCLAVRNWIAAWRQGRGKPVDRIALERSEILTDHFLDLINQLSHSLNGDGVALIAALRNNQVPRFRAARTNELEQWLESEGYIDLEEPLTVEERLTRTLMDTAGCASPEEIRQIVTWLEAGTSIRKPADASS